MRERSITSQRIPFAEMSIAAAPFLDPLSHNGKILTGGLLLVIGSLGIESSDRAVRFAESASNYSPVIRVIHSSLTNEQKPNEELVSEFFDIARRITSPQGAGRFQFSTVDSDLFIRDELELSYEINPTKQKIAAQLIRKRPTDYTSLAGEQVYEAAYIRTEVRKGVARINQITIAYLSNPDPKAATNIRGKGRFGRLTGSILDCTQSQLSEGVEQLRRFM